MGWLARWFPGRRSEPAPPAAASAAKSAPAAPLSVPAAPAEPARPLLSWLLERPAAEGPPRTDNEKKVLAALDTTLALPALPEDLLPRAAALIPQLLAMLRQTQLPVPALAQRIAKDVVLTAEVLRLASSPFYRAQGQVTDLEQAIQLIGEAGLQSVIARVVLKPIYDATPGAWSGLAAARLWEHSEALAADGANAAAEIGAAMFDGYLAGLLHDAGWTVALRIVDKAGLPLPVTLTGDFCRAMERRAHRLFAKAAQRWTITPEFSAFCAEAREHPLATAKHPLAAALRKAQPLVLADLDR